MKKFRLIIIFSLLASSWVMAKSMTVSVDLVFKDGKKESIGEVNIEKSDYGLVFMPNLKGLPPGLHGFHIHENPSCEPKEKDGQMVAGLEAGGHYDPKKTGKHGYSWGDGHLGDLPALYVDDQGNASTAVLAPRIKKLSEIKKRSLMVHAGGDNHSDSPNQLGGGGARIACGVIK